MRKIRIGVIGHMAKMRRIFQEILKGYNVAYIDSKFDYETAYAETPLFIINGIPIVNYETRVETGRYDVVYVQNGILTTDNYNRLLEYTNVIEL